MHATKKKDLSKKIDNAIMLSMIELVFGTIIYSLIAIFGGIIAFSIHYGPKETYLTIKFILETKYEEFLDRKNIKRYK